MPRSLCLLLFSLPLAAQSRDEILAALKKAAQFYAGPVSPHGGYHYYYAADLQYGRSEHSEGMDSSENQREATPLAGMTFLEAWDATGDRFYLDAARRVAFALVRGQHCSGGWDYSIEFNPERRKSVPYRADGNCAARANTTLDDNTTAGCLRFLMRTDRALGFADAAIHDAALYALEKLAAAQYPNGAWPQRYHQPPDPANFPVKRASYPESWPRKWPGPDYQTLYTLNDNVLSDAIDTFLEAARIYNQPRYREVAERGGGFILLAQMPDPQPAWAQQYDREMHPAWARAFEPPAVTGGESIGVMKTLLVLYQETGDRKYLEPVPRALDYFRRSALPAVEKEIEARSRIPKGAPVLARFYELKTNRPLYITKGTRVTVEGRSVANLDGYQLSYDDSSVITHYNVLVSGANLARVEAEYRRLAAADPTTVRRSDRLHGLSPWAEYADPGPAQGRFPPRSSSYGPRQGRSLADRPRVASREEIRRIIDALDPRGAWVEPGSIGKADRVVSVLAARDMVVKIGDRTYALPENQTLEVFRGPQPPPERIIATETFAWNAEALIGALKGQ